MNLTAGQLARRFFYSLIGKWFGITTCPITPE
jgi:hypothetical protein